MAHSRDTMPPPGILDTILGPATHVLRSVDIYEEDGISPFLMGVGVLDGSISVDAGRDERRTMDLSLDNSDGRLRHYPGGFWYDKVIKAYRGVHSDSDDLHWDIQIGEFLIDDITSAHFPSTVSITGRDYTKKLLEDEFPGATTFAKGLQMTVVIEAIARNGGITEFLMHQSDRPLGKNFEFEAGTTRWQAIHEIALAYGHEAFFDPFGNFVLREVHDPVSSPLSFTFETGATGNLVNFSKRTGSARLYNAIVVTGKNPDNDLPIVAVAENNMPGSPTSIQALGRRKVYRYTSEFMTTLEQCQDVANKFLLVHSLEEFDMSMESIVLPWLEASEIIEFRDPDPNPGDPTRFLLHNFTIPMNLGPMSVTAKRVQIVLDPAPPATPAPIWTISA